LSPPLIIHKPTKEDREFSRWARIGIKTTYNYELTTEFEPGGGGAVTNTNDRSLGMQ